MEILTSKQVGNITEVEVTLAFLKLGYTVLQPYGDCNRYDLVVEINNAFYRIQCKAASQATDSYFVFNCRSTHKSGGKIIHHKYSKDEIDFFATCYNDNVYLVPVELCGAQKKLRLLKPKNCQEQNISYAKDFLLEEVVKTL
jgi:hypothetical protein